MRQQVSVTSVTIQCPSCYRIQPATIEFWNGDPWPIYVHECDCGYTITESEWEEVKINEGGGRENGQIV